jgi:hypothetical protein
MTWFLEDLTTVTQDTEEKNAQKLDLLWIFRLNLPRKLIMICGSENKKWIIIQCQI